MISVQGEVMGRAVVLGAVVLALTACAANTEPTVDLGSIKTGTDTPGLSAPDRPAQTDQAELLFWASIMQGRNKADFQEYLNRYPNGAFANLARRRIEALSLPGANFIFRKVEVSRGSEKGIPTLLITGEIVNISRDTHDLPEVRLTLLDVRGEALKAWTVPIVLSRLGPNADVPFHFTVRQPPAAATCVTVSFAKAATQ